MRHLLLTTSILLVLTGCASLQDMQQALNNNAKSAVPIQEKTVTLNRWWETFNDPVMNKLADELLAQNLDIQIAQTRIAEARGLLKTSESGWFPSIDMKGSASRGNEQIGVDKAASIAKGGFDTKWELDLFGQTRNQVNADEARVEARIASVDDMKNIVLSELMRSVIEWRQANETIRETKALLETQDNQIKLFSVRTKAGLTDATLQTRAQAERSQTATRLPVAQAAADAAKFKIARLLAKPVDQLALDADTKQSFTIPDVEKTIAIDIETIRKRPDLRALRAEMLAAQSDVAKAEADLWPKLSIGAFFGVQDGSKNLLMAGNPIWSLAAGITAPVLNFGRLRGAVDAADARASAASLNYENSALTALQETQTALSDYLNGINAVTEQETALTHRKETIKLATERFEKGLTDMTDLTTAQSELNQATITLIERRAAAATAYIRLQKALGVAFHEKVEPESI